MKKLLAILMAAALCCACALAETDAAWNGPVLVGTLPKDAELIGSEESADGYRETLFYNGYVRIALARFATTHAREAFLDSQYPPADAEAIEFLDVPATVAGCEATHLRYETGANEDTNVVDAYCFASGEDIYLFLTATDSDAYYGFCDDETDYVTLPDFWAETLEIFQP